MTIENAIELIRKCSAKMEKLYGGLVFDEWLVAQFPEKSGVIIFYEGPRRGEFQKDFATDVKDLESRLFSHAYGPGDFEFSRFANGTQFEAFIALGSRVYLLFNNTGKSLAALAQDGRWLAAQGAFFELADMFRVDPLIYFDQKFHPMVYRENKPPNKSPSQ